MKMNPRGKLQGHRVSKKRHPDRAARYREVRNNRDKCFKCFCYTGQRLDVLVG